jgi:hypothetical protein
MAVQRHNIFYALTFAGLLAGCVPDGETYAKSCATKLSHWRSEKDGIGHLLPVISISVSSAGRLSRTFRSNVSALSDVQLREFMNWANSAIPQPQIVLEVAPDAPCDRVRTVRAIMDESAICHGQYSLCSEGRNWRDWPLVGGP